MVLPDNDNLICNDKFVTLGSCAFIRLRRIRIQPLVREIGYGPLSGIFKISVDELNPNLCLDESFILSNDRDRVLGLARPRKGYLRLPNVLEVMDWSLCGIDIAFLVIPKNINSLGE